MKKWWNKLTDKQKLGIKICLVLFVAVMAFIVGLGLGGYLTFDDTSSSVEVEKETDNIEESYSRFNNGSFKLVCPTADETEILEVKIGQEFSCFLSYSVYSDIKIKSLEMSIDFGSAFDFVGATSLEGYETTSTSVEIANVGRDYQINGDKYIEYKFKVLDVSDIDEMYINLKDIKISTSGDKKYLVEEMERRFNGTLGYSISLLEDGELYVGKSLYNGDKNEVKTLYYECETKDCRFIKVLGDNVLLDDVNIISIDTSSGEFTDTGLVYDHYSFYAISDVGFFVTNSEKEVYYNVEKKQALIEKKQVLCTSEIEDCGWELVYLSDVQAIYLKSQKDNFTSGKEIRNRLYNLDGTKFKPDIKSLDKIDGADFYYFELYGWTSGWTPYPKHIYYVFDKEGNDVFSENDVFHIESLGNGKFLVVGDTTRLYDNGKLLKEIDGQLLYADDSGVSTNILILSNNKISLYNSELSLIKDLQTIESGYIADARWDDNETSDVEILMTTSDVNEEGCFNFINYSFDFATNELKELERGYGECY